MSRCRGRLSGVDLYLLVERRNCGSPRCGDYLLKGPRQTCGIIFSILWIGTPEACRIGSFWIDCVWESYFALLF